MLWVFVPEVLAHSPPGSGNNESFATATVIPDPMKSWALYAQLHEGGEANYCEFNITVGQGIHIMLYKSRRSDEAAFSPSFVLMGPDLVEQGSVPNYLQKPPDAKLLTVQGKQATDASYEPFSPSSFYSMVDLEIDAPATGTYYVAVFEPYEGGPYGLAIGDRESYGIAEWILIPFNLISIYHWEGQSLMMILSSHDCHDNDGFGTYHLENVQDVRTWNSLDMAWSARRRAFCRHCRDNTFRDDSCLDWCSYWCRNSSNICFCSDSFPFRICHIASITMERRECRHTEKSVLGCLRRRRVVHLIRSANWSDFCHCC